jgi:hypothetical protein
MMSNWHDPFYEALIRERERSVARLVAEAQFHAPSRSPRPHTLRERVGFSLIQAGRALLRPQAAYSTARRRAV